MKRAATVALAPFGGLYGLFVRSGNALYRRGILQTQDVGAPVISVGNLTTGGTGKTPLVEWIASELASRGRKVCVLTRGYRRENPDQRVLASDGNTILSDVRQTGDEALLLAENLRGKAAVVCDANRVSGARWAMTNLESDAFVLDDGFQHRRIARQLDIVTIDATNPWGNGRLLPVGTLREPREALARADCIVITRADLCDPQNLRLEIEKICPELPLLFSRMTHTRLRAIAPNSAEVDSDQIRSSPVLAFCGIGNPGSFFLLLNREGFDVAHTHSFRDHHGYAQDDINQIANEAQRLGVRALLTTAKDAVKLRAMDFAVPCYSLEIEVEIEGGDLLRELILKTIS